MSGKNRFLPAETQPCYIKKRLTMMGEGRDASSSMQTSIAFWWNSSSIFIAWQRHINTTTQAYHTNT